MYIYMLCTCTCFVHVFPRYCINPLPLPVCCCCCFQVVGLGGLAERDPLARLAPLGGDAQQTAHSSILRFAVTAVTFLTLALLLVSCEGVCGCVCVCVRG